MSLIEFIGETVNPGPIGEVEIQRDRRPPKNKFVFVHFIISSIVLIGIESLYTNYANDPGLNLDFLIFNGILLIYLVCSYFITVRPNKDNLGWVPFIVDNPFRFSDDLNRYIVMLMIVLSPGKYVLSSFINYYLHLKLKSTR